jgi:predicted metalloprotease with PDZ domain
MYLTRVLLTCYSTAGGPAFQAGLKRGDRILSVNGKALHNQFVKKNPWGSDGILVLPHQRGAFVQEMLSTSDNPGDKVYFPF